MKTIAFKLAEYIKQLVTDPDIKLFVLEYTDISSRPEGSLLESDGWHFLPEDEFSIYLAEANTNENIDALKLRFRNAEDELYLSRRSQ